jgi:flagellin
MSFGILSSTAAAAQSPLQQFQSDLFHALTKASTGKRINTAADDPSGLAISQSLTAQANGFDAASQNVQNANNALNVADGALQTTTDSLNALNTLAIAASNDLLSPSDRANLQTVANQLVQQINTDAQNATFNGTQLLTGQFSGATPATAASPTVTQNASLTGGGNLVQNVSTAPGAQAGTISLSVVNTGSGTAVQTSFTNSATGQTTVQSTVAQPGQTIVVNGTSISLGSFGSGDVSDTATVQVSGAQAAGTASSLNVQSGANEGATTNFTLPNGSSSGLFIGDLDLSSSAAATNAQGQVSAALEGVSNARATLGAQIVSADQQLNANNTASTNLIASASNIADQNTAAISTELTRLRIQQQISIDTLNAANDQFGFLNRFFNLGV